MPRSLFVGSAVALVTPFGGDGVDEEVLRELVRFHRREGTDALVVNGSTGEAATMSADEQRGAIEVVVGEAERRIPVIAGVGGSDTAAVARLARQAREAGADALLLAPPPYNKPTQQGMLAHFRAVLDAADLPLIAYNVPGRTACNLLPETLEQLADDARLVGVKEASGDLSQTAELARRVSGQVAIYSGNDDQILPVLSLGGQGVISVLANVAPADTARMVHRFLESEFAAARALQLRYLPLIHALFREPNPVPVKAAVQMLGFDAGDPRLPLLPASAESRDALRAAMREVGIQLREG
ncbi:MAG TPA: 4-hydroxy-tetrahydrodipicolinate synthase [Longimicrobiaceae bacterium]|nr:4-hydroxy-tetrahydrodipicolinate synthase [Longimicrobiaceae bacterium]